MTTKDVIRRALTKSEERSRQNMAGEWLVPDTLLCLMDLEEEIRQYADRQVRIATNGWKIVMIFSWSFFVSCAIAAVLFIKVMR